MNNTNFSVSERPINTAFCHQLKRFNNDLPMVLRGCLAVFGVVVLSACANGKTITTVDNSADYKTAVARAPLKKPSKVLTSSTTETEIVAVDDVDSDVETQSNTLGEAQDTVVTQTPEAATETAASNATNNADQAFVPGRIEPAVEPLPEVTPDLKVSSDNTETELEGTEPGLEVDEATALEDQAEQSQDITLRAQVISPKDNVSRLQVEADFDDAWLYLSRNLQNSDVTVFSRNKAAGRFAIGCSGIDSAPTVDKKGGWSFFNKRQKQQAEYCSLQAAATKGVTVVTVLNRFNEEVDGQSAGQIFSRILNN